MATLSELRYEVSKIIQDSSFNDDTIDSYLNRGMLEIAGGIRRPDSSVITMPLPQLFEIGTITTTATFKTSLPVDYQRDVVMAIDKYNRIIPIYDSFMEFARVYPGMIATGAINAIAVKGREIYYQGVPASPENITIHYHRYPVDMIGDNDEPDGIPKNLHIPLLVNFACKEIYSLIEDGMDGAMPNTAKYEAKFMAALDRLEASISADAEPFSFTVGR